MTPTRAVRLVAARDFLERVRSRAFQVSTAITVLLVAGLVVVPAVLDSDEEPAYFVAHVGDPLPGLPQQLDAALGDTATATLEGFQSAAQAEAALRSGDVDVVVVNGREIVTGPGTDGKLTALVAAAVGSAALLERADELGMSSGDLRALLGSDVELRELEPEDPEDDANRGFALIGVIFLFISIVTYGQWILIGVIEEKSNRVVEVVLGAVRPRHLLAGKIAGIGALGLAQFLLVAGLAIGGVALFDTFELPSAAVGVLVAVLVWFVLGFVFYAAAYAATGSLASRQEEAQNAAFPLTLLLMVAYFIATFSFAGDNPLLRVASLLPPFAPVTMPLRMASGDASLWEIVTSLTLMVAGTYLLIGLAGRIYAGGLLRTGGKVKLRTAWRSAEV